MSIRDQIRRQEDFFDVCCNCKVGYACCRGTRPPITKERKQIIEAYLKKKKTRTAEAFAEEGYVFPREGVEGYCVFHDMQTHQCKIHQVKPETCVAGPITFDVNRKSGSIEWYIKLARICPLAGKVKENKQLLQKHLMSAKAEICRLVHALSEDELDLILAKDEPETCRLKADL